MVRLVFLVAVALALAVLLIIKKSGQETTLTLEINQPGPEVWIDGAERPSQVDAPGVRYSFNLSPGQHTFRVLKQGFQPVNQTVKLEAHEQQVIRVTLDPAVMR